MLASKSLLSGRLILFAAPLAFCSCILEAQAGGGFSEPMIEQSTRGATAVYSSRGDAVASKSVTITASGDGFSFTSTTGGVAAGRPVASAAMVWDATTVHTSVYGEVKVNSSSFTNSFSKAGSSISKGISTTETTVSINGATYAVAKELAFAVARATEFGASAYVEVQGTLATPANGYSSSPVTATKASR
jgi:hypothetical protein